MTDVKRLLDEATPLPWMWLIDSYEPAKVYITNDPTDQQEPIIEQVSEADAALIEYAVNRLPDYEAAVDALERLVETSQMFRFTDKTGVSAKTLHRAELDGRAVLARLRKGVRA